jgi:hypothetical protein
MILGFSNPIASIDIHWPALLEEPAGGVAENVGDLTQGDESSSSTGSWQDTCDLTMLEPGAASFMALACEETPFDAEQVHMPGQVEIA